MDDLESQQIALLNQWMGRTGPVSPGVLASFARTSEGDLWRHLSVLQKAGCHWLDHPAQGLELQKVGLGCWADYLHSRHPRGIGCCVRVYEQTASTQAVAKDLIQRGSPVDGMVVVADHQTAGRGRFDRRWFAAPGCSILMTALVRSDRGACRLTLGAALAAAEAVEQTCGLSPQVRWPNDLYLHRKKLAGILIEQVGTWALVGLGLNVRSEPAGPPKQDAGRPFAATSLEQEGARLWRLQLLDLLLERLQTHLTDSSDRHLADQWRMRCDQMQQRVTAMHDGRQIVGRVIDLDPAFGLLLSTDEAMPVTLPPHSTRLETCADPPTGLEIG